MIRSIRRSAARRGSTMVESALVLLVYAVLMAGIMELGVVEDTPSTPCPSPPTARRAMRPFAGSTTASPATAAQIVASAQGYAAPLAGAALTVAVSWSPSGNNSPGSTVQVKVSYNFEHTTFLPVDSGVLILRTTACEIISQ